MKRCPCCFKHPHYAAHSSSLQIGMKVVETMALLCSLSHTHTHTHTYTHTNTHTETHTHSVTCFLSVHKDVCMRMLNLTHTCAHTCLHICSRIRPHIYSDCCQLYGQPSHATSAATSAAVDNSHTYTHMRTGCSQSYDWPAHATSAATSAAVDGCTPPSCTARLAGPHGYRRRAWGHERQPSSSGVCVFVCVCVCKCVCTYVGIFVYMHVFLCAWTCAWLHICVCECEREIPVLCRQNKHRFVKESWVPCIPLFLLPLPV